MGRLGDLLGRQPIIGVIHLPPLPGYPTSPGIDAVVIKALRDLEALEEGEVDGVLVENEEDRPHRVEAAAETVAAMTRVTGELVRAARKTKIGVEILLNDPCASIAVAHAAGASFVRTDYFVDPMERPEHGGLMKIDPVGLLAHRERLGGSHVLILADIQVKYARMTIERSLAESARLAREHGADGIVVTGSVTGMPPSSEDVGQAKAGAGDRLVLIGSGLDAANAASLLGLADGAIVGTSLKTADLVDGSKVKAVVAAARSVRPAR